MVGSLGPAIKRKAEESNDEQRREADRVWLSPDEEERLREEERALMRLLRERANGGAQKAAA